MCILLTHTQKWIRVIHGRKIRVKSSLVKSFYLRRQFLGHPFGTSAVCSGVCTIRRPYQASIPLNYLEMKWHSFTGGEVYDSAGARDHGTGRNKSQIPQIATAKGNFLKTFRIFQTINFLFIFCLLQNLISTTICPTLAHLQQWAVWIQKFLSQKLKPTKFTFFRNRLLNVYKLSPTYFGSSWSSIKGLHVE
jgi:hypothetical protein